MNHNQISKAFEIASFTVLFAALTLFAFFAISSDALVELRNKNLNAEANWLFFKCCFVVIGLFVIHIGLARVSERFADRQTQDDIQVQH